MKLHILSDVHNEFQPYKPPDIDSDIVVLAGDINLGLRGLDWIEKYFSGKPVIYICGNHEYYRHSMPKLTEQLREATTDSHIHFLENDTYEYEDVIFLGCTLWTDFELFDNHRIAQFEAAKNMNDYRLIRVAPKYRKLRPSDTSILHFQSIQFLNENLEKYRDRKIVVVTHHAPSIKSVPEFFKSDIISAAYTSNLEDLIRKNNISLWIHGHLHESSDYYIENTRILSNPAGYPDVRNHDFIPDLVVEI